MSAVVGQVANPNEIGVLGESSRFEGVRGISHAGDSHGAVVGINDNETNTAGPGVYGKSRGTGVWGESETWMGVYGHSASTTGGHGVMGEGAGTGVVGVGKTWLGVYGETNAPASAGAAGVLGEGKDGGDGVKGHARGRGKAAVCGFHLTNQGPGVFGKGAPAGLFEGDVVITGNLTLQGVSIQTWLQRIVQLEQQGASVGQLVQRMNSLEQKVAALQSQVNTAVSNLTGRVTQTEAAISDLKYKVQQIIERLG